jgi:hypothetical protein
VFLSWFEQGGIWVDQMPSSRCWRWSMTQAAVDSWFPSETVVSL